MTEDHKQQLEAFFDAQLEPSWRQGGFFHLDGWQTTEALWPMNAVFAAHRAQIGSIAYVASFESEADEALASLARGRAWTLNTPSPGAWRVLMERHIQSLMLAMANAVAGNSQVIPVPSKLPSTSYKLAAMLFLQWSMKLPFPVEDRASYEWPSGQTPGSLRQH